MEKKFSIFNGKTIVVTGASGFVGNRLVELLATKSTSRIRAIVRNYGGAIRLARHSIEIIQGDILNKESIRKAFDGVDFVFHCAYGNKGSEGIRHEVNFIGTRNVLELSSENKISALLFLSTVAVYGNVASGKLTEETSSNELDAYGKSKLEAEKLVLEFGAKKSLPVVVLQPTGVYGPWAQSYGIKMAHTLSKFVFPLEAHSRGQANLVYVDDLVQAMVQAITSPKAIGNRYLINGPTQQTWKQFFEHFGEMLKVNCFQELNRDQILAVYRESLKKPPFFKTLSRAIKIDKAVATELLVYPSLKVILKIRRLVFPVRAARLTKVIKIQKSELPVLPMNEQTLDSYKSEAIVCSDKAIADFGYAPEFTMEEGFSRMSAWHRWYSNE